MNECLSLSWTISAQSTPSYGGSVDNPNWHATEDKLLQSLRLGGTVTLDAEDESGRPRSLQVRADSGMFVVTFGIETESDWIVRTYHNPIAQSEKILILGDAFNAGIVCRDASLVVSVFDEFFSTGDVSENLLS